MYPNISGNQGGVASQCAATEALLTVMVSCALQTNRPTTDTTITHVALHVSGKAQICDLTQYSMEFHHIHKAADPQLLSSNGYPVQNA